MSSYSPPRSPVFCRLLAPLIEAYALSERRYACTGIPDLCFLEMGVARVLSDSRTGRDFLQRHGDGGGAQPALDHWFKALGSGRRLANTASVNGMLAPVMEAVCPDPFAAMPELDGFALYAGDGHYHGAACHDAPMRSGNGQMKKYPTGHFFLLDLRTHHISHITAAEQGGARKGEHDMRAIKRSETDTLRGGQPKGKKVLISWDPAGIDFAFWQRVKRSSGLYFVSRQKDNMKLEIEGYRDFERWDERNRGVVSDQRVTPASGGGLLRRVTYVDPIDGTRYVYITTEMTLPPWAIVLAYRHRWDIEKVFDEFKSKLGERKSWGSKAETKAMQAQLLCITHNLMTLLEEEVSEIEGVENGPEKERRELRAKREKGRGATFISTALQRFTVRSLKFIRWLRNHIYTQAPWGRSIERLRHAYSVF